MKTYKLRLGRCSNFTAWKVQVMSGVHPYAIYYTIFESFNIDD